MNGIIMNSMIFSFLLLACIGPSIDSITVSPDIRYRNSSIAVSLRRKADVNHISLAALTNDHGSPVGVGSDANGGIDRQRRLIPYMTFYMPTHEYHNPPISQAYAYNMPLKLHPIQQSQAPQHTVGQPIKQQLILVQSQPQHQSYQQQQQQHHTAIYRQQQKYQRPSVPIAYNTRQQVNYKSYAAPTAAPKQKVVYEAKPVVYKITAADYEAHQQQQQHQYQEDVYQKYKPHQASNVFTPFLPSNQLPGPFVPMSSHYSPPKYETTEDDRQEPEKSEVYHHQEQSYHQTYVTVAPTHKYHNHNYHTPSQYSVTPEPAKTYYQHPDAYVNAKHIILQQEKPHYAAAPPDVEEPQYVKYEKPLPAKPKPEYQVKQIYLRPVEVQQAPITHRTPATHLTLHKGKYGGFKPNYSTTSAPTTHHTTPEAYDEIEYYPKLAQKPIYYPMSTTATPYRPKLVMKTQLRPATSGTRYATPKPPTIKYHHPPQATTPVKIDYQQDFKDRSLADILKKLQDSNTLPHTLTPDNIDNSIRTLVKILDNLKQTQTIHQTPPQKHQHIDYDSGDEYYDTDDDTSGQMGPNSGKPGVDYPALAEIPKTSFSCKEQRYKGFFGDPETLCQVWHYCDLNGGQASFLCPNGTIFSQVALTCDWWFNVKCSSTAQLYVLNERLYKYILPFQPKFPEDYSGPLVDKYLALKFKEMEEKMQREKSKNKSSPPAATTSSEEDVEVVNPPSSDEATSAEAEPQHFATTEMSRAPPPPPPHPPLAHAANIETEKLEVIEINAAGTSGHLTPHQLPDYGA